MKRKRQLNRTGREEEMCAIFHKWMKERAGEPGDLTECYQFAKERRLYEKQPWSEEKMFKLEMSRAISRERIVDDEGNPIRTNHVYRSTLNGQLVFYWGELLKMKPDKVKLSLKQRLHGLGSRAVQIERDKNFYNEKNQFGGLVEGLDYDLNLFVQDANNPTEYPDERPDDDEG